MSVNQSVVFSAEELSDLCGEGYFDVLTQKLNQILSADYTFVAKIINNVEAETISFWGNEQHYPAIHYSLKGTPCEDLRCHGGACILEDVATKYPDDQFLIDLAIEGYIGITLVDEQGKVIGIFSSLFTRPIHVKDVPEITKYFKTFANRASRELSRLQYEQLLQSEITSLQDKNDKLQIAQQVYDFSKDGIIITDSANAIIYVNASLEKMTGYRMDELRGKNPSILNSGIQDKAFYKNLWHVLTTKKYWQGELWNRSKSGQVFPIFTCISSIPDEQGGVKNYVAIHRDITTEKESQELIAYQATHDSLTGLLNRYEFNSQLRQKLRSMRIDQAKGAFLLLDVDDFKSVNDTQGHVLGDLILQMIARRLKELLGEDVILARLGGDEFAIFTLFTDFRALSNLTNDIVNSFAEPFCLDTGMSVYCHSSVGVSMYPEDAMEAVDLFKCADQAMYKAKSSGGSNYAFFTSTMREAVERHQIVRQRLACALNQHQITVYYQPIIELESGRVAHCEALARWTDDELGTVSPDEFISVAENSGLIGQLGDQVYRAVLRDVKTINAQLADPISISMNRSPQEFKNLNYQVRSWITTAKEAGIPAEWMAIEITENLMLQDPALAKEQLELLQASGFSTYLDDFGTGYSSLAYLKRFSFDVLKIDRSFIADLPEDEGDMTLVKTIMEMGRNLGMKVIAEGVETVEQKDILTSLGCHYAQGYYYSKPLPLESLLRYIKTGA